jgi:hypothetical protein
MDLYSTPLHFGIGKAHTQTHDELHGESCGAVQLFPNLDPDLMRFSTSRRRDLRPCSLGNCSDLKIRNAAVEPPELDDSNNYDIQSSIALTTPPFLP